MNDGATGGTGREDDGEPGTSAVGELVARCAARVLRGRRHGPVRLRDLLAPVWAEVLHETMFGGRCPPGVRALIVAEAGAWFAAPAFPGPRRRIPSPAGAGLAGYVAARPGEARLPAPGGAAGAAYLRDVLGTGVARMTEGSAHVLMVLARRPDLQYEAGADPTLLDAVIEETSRLYAAPPASAAAHRPDRLLGRREPDAIRAAVEEVIWRYAVTTTASHTPDLANRGPCLLVPRSGRAAAPPLLRGLLLWLWVRDRWEILRRAAIALPGARPLLARRPGREPLPWLTRDGGVGSFR